MKLTSTAFEQGQPIPKCFTGEGINVSPPLEWEDVPPDTQQFAITCVDLNAPGPEPWVHWLLYGIPGSERSLPEHVQQTQLPSSLIGARHGVNSFSIGNIQGYQGPMPHARTGVHHYVFTIYALATRLDLEAGLHLRTVLSAMKGQILAQAELMGSYTR
jgi:Raf kinase inhibitor-like YbhB/YbcL family protein